MDCEKFEATLIDELEGELDEITSAAHKRHASGCARCASLMSGMRATRRVAVLPLVDPPQDLEERILSAARAAQKVVPFRAKVSRFVSRAGAWAMRPQTAMAAVFLLVMGSSLVLMKSGRHASEPARATVRAEGAPAEQMAPAGAAASAMDLTAAAEAHGTEEKAASRPVVTTTTPDDIPAQGSALAMDEKKQGMSAGGGGAAEGHLSEAQTRRERGAGGDTDRLTAANAGPVAGAPAPTATTGMAAPPPAAHHASATKTSQTGGAGSFDTAMAAYHAGRYNDAMQMFDALGDASSALWAARSVREGSGCAAAVGRFDSVGTRFWNTTPGYEATLDAGRCYRAMGNTSLARARLSRLLAVPAYAARAQDELDAMAPASAKDKEAPRPARRPANIDQANGF